MSCTLLHIGYPKAGSSTLQKIFANEDSVFNLFLSRKNITKLTDELQLLHELTHADGIEYNERRVLNYINTICDCLPVNDNRIPVVSEEFFTASSTAYADRSLMAERLKRLFPDSFVLIIIRNQFEIIRSRYQHNPTDIHALSRKGNVKSIDEWLSKSLERWWSTYLSTYIYFDLIEFYRKLFGEQRVLVVPFEEMVQNPKDFLTYLTHQLGVEELDNFISTSVANVHENASIASRKKKLSHNVNLQSLLKMILKGKLCRNVSNNNSQLFVETIWKLYAEDNARVANRYGLDLHRHGYPMPSVSIPKT